MTYLKQEMHNGLNKGLEGRTYKITYSNMIGYFKNEMPVFQNQFHPISLFRKLFDSHWDDRWDNGAPLKLNEWLRMIKNKKNRIWTEYNSSYHEMEFLGTTTVAVEQKQQKRMIIFL